jgi:NAD(P)-dependent dehydrogenase (short-subunit alcohol dehydrogenase family)
VPDTTGLDSRVTPFSDDVLAGMRVIITGGTRGIGHGVAAYLGRHGAEVLVTGRSCTAAEDVAAGLRSRGIAAHGYELEVTDASSINRLVDSLWRDHGGVHCLVNNAGTNIPQPALDVTEEAWDTVLDANLKGTFFMSQAVARRWVSSRLSGTIVNIASQAGLVAIDLRAAYCSSKAGVVNLTRELALEWAAQGIRVNAVAPTFVRTSMTESMLADERFEQEVLSMIPLGRVAAVDDVAAAVLFLTSGAAASITGHTLVVDGGWTIH